MVVALKHYHARALAHDESAAVGVKGARRALGLVVEFRGHGLHGGKTRKSEGCYSGFAAARKNHVLAARLQVEHRLAYGVGARGACAHNTEIDAFGAEFDGDHARRHIREKVGYHEWGNPARAPFDERARLRFDGVHAAHAGADKDAEAFGFKVFADFKAGVNHGKL